MGFKESLKEDLDNVFLDIDEFADTHKVNDAYIPIIIDDEGLEEFNQKRDGDYDGLFKAKMLFFVKESDLGYKPAIDSIIDIDDRSYQVKQVSCNGSMLKIILGWNED